MAITIVGTAQAAANINGDNVTITFDGTPAENDLVVLVGGNADSNGNNAVGPVTLGYTQAALYKLNDGTPITSGVWYKFLTSTPDGSVEANGGGVSQEAVAYAAIVLRGVDTSTPLDATVVETGPTVGTNPDLSAITTVTDGAWVIAAANLAKDDPATGGPTGYSNFVTAVGNDTRGLSVGLATKEVASAGSEDPGAFSGWESAAWYGFTIAIRPATAGGETQALTGTLFQNTPTFFAGTVTPGAASLTGSLFANTPTFFTGAITPGEVTLTGTLFQSSPTFFTGTVAQDAQPLTGTLFQNTPSFFTGTVTPGAVELTGSLFQSAPTFFTGTVAAGTVLSGQLFQSTPTFFVGTVTPDQTLSGVLFQSTPEFFVGRAFNVVAHVEPTPSGAALTTTGKAGVLLASAGGSRVVVSAGASSADSQSGVSHADVSDDGQGGAS